MNATAPPARLKTRYLDEIRPALIERFGYTSSMQAPKLEKVTLNMGVGSAKQDSKALKAAQDQLATIAGQHPSIRRARKSIAAFKLREGMPVGVAVTLRGERAYEFLDRLISIAIPRIRDFRGLSARSFDGRGNYSLGVREQIIFPEIDYDAIDEVRGLDITITTSAASDPEAYALLASLGMPYTRQGMPKRLQELADDGFGPAAEDAAGGQRPAPAPAVDETPPQSAEATGPDAQAELPSTDVSEAELPAGEAPEAGSVSEEAQQALPESDGSAVDAEPPSEDVSEAEPPSEEVSEAESPREEVSEAELPSEDVSEAEPPSEDVSEAELQSTDISEADLAVGEAARDEFPAASADGDSTEASVTAEHVQVSSDGETSARVQSAEAGSDGDVDGDAADASASGDSAGEAPGDDSNDTEDAD